MWINYAVASSVHFDDENLGDVMTNTSDTLLSAMLGFGRDRACEQGVSEPS